jgi:CorA-like Mg2+ transporter protein
MGRSLLLGEWLAEDKSDYEYLNQAENSSYPLTAIGYGEPAFAAYYPNCYSVFGFCDVDEGLNPDGNYEYQVIGWYNEPSLDPLRSPHLAGLSSDAERYDALKSEYGWVLTDADRQEAFPQRTVCYASLVLSPHDAGPWASGGDVDISIANTGGEALAALLADKAASGQNQDALKRQIEDQLEAVLECLADPGVQDPGSKSDLGKRLGGARNRARWINSRISEFVGLLQNLFNANLTLVSVKQSDQTRRISAWAAIIAVPTIIASIYGMNFRYMPELGWRFGYPLALLAMVAICVVLYVVFKRIRWL